MEFGLNFSVGIILLQKLPQKEVLTDSSHIIWSTNNKYAHIKSVEATVSSAKICIFSGVALILTRSSHLQYRHKSKTIPYLKTGIV